MRSRRARIVDNRDQDRIDHFLQLAGHARRFQRSGTGVPPVLGVWTFLVPEGPLETSPRFQPWVAGTGNRSSPAGTAEVHSHKHRGSYSTRCLFSVPTESRRTDPWEPGSREGNRLVLAATGRRGQDPEPVAFVYGTAAGGDGRLPIGGTVCGKSARTGLWGCRRATAGTTRKARSSRPCESCNQHTGET